MYIKHIYIIFPRLGEREGTRDLRGDGPCSIGHVYQLFGLRHLLLLPHSVYNPHRHIIIGPTTSHTHPPTPPDATRHHHRRRMWSRRLLNISHSHKKERKRHGEITSQVDKNAIEMITHIANCLFGYLSRPVHFLGWGFSYFFLFLASLFKSNATVC